MIVTAGATNRSVYFYITGDASHASPGDPITGLLFSDIETGGSASYARQGAARVDLTLITLASASATHADGGFILVDDTTMPGVYRCDYPDAAFATGVDQVFLDLVVASAKNAHVAPILVDLPSFIADIAAILVDTGTTLDTKLDDVQGATFSSATDSLEALRNRGDAAWTGSATTSDTGTAQAGSSTTITLAATAPSTDNILEGHLVFISTGTGAGQSKAIAENGYDGTTKVATIIGTWEVNPDATSVYEVTPDAITEITNAPTAAVIADTIWDENTTGHTNAGTFGEQLKNDVDAILVDTGLMEPKIGAPAADLAADIAAVKVDSAAILVDTDVIGALGAGLTDLGGMSTGMKAEVNAEADTAVSDASLATAAALATVDGIVDAILVDTDTTVPALITGLNDLSAANVNAEVVDALNVDTYVEPGQKLPPMDASLVEKIGFMYKAWRNKSTETATQYSLFNDDASTVDQKAVVSDDATTATKAEVATGP